MLVQVLPDSPAGAADKLWHMNNLALTFLQDDQELLPVMVEFWAYALRNPAAAASFRDLFQTMQRSLAEIITSGVEQGEFKPIDVEPLSTLPLVILDGVILLSLVVGRDLVEPERVIKETQSLVLEGLLA
jgi:hypothetical protein